VNRRQFLLTAPSTVALAGCGGRGGPAGPPGPVVTAADAARIAAERQARDEWLAALPTFRVPPTAVRTTPKPPADVLAAVPELKGLVKITTRLHPRFSDEPGPDETKLGGRFAWPAATRGRPAPDHHVPYTAVLQLRADDAPPQWPFPPGMDLFQLLWCPRDHADSKGWVRPAVRWRKRSEAAAGPQADPPDHRRGLPRVRPGRVPALPGAGGRIPRARGAAASQSGISSRRGSRPGRGTAPPRSPARNCTQRS
jgi:hypothetical protein